MSRALLFVVALIAAFRFWTLYVASTNEKRMKADGAIEYGQRSTLALFSAIAIVYVGALIEGFSYRHAQFDRIGIVGLGVYLFSAITLVWVMRTLGQFWSAKVIISPHHELVVHPLFRQLKHPNYFLNVIPELIGFSIMLHAWITLAVGVPLVLISLFFRIRIEEQVLKNKFEAY